MFGAVIRHHLLFDFNDGFFLNRLKFLANSHDQGKAKRCPYEAGANNVHATYDARGVHDSLHDIRTEPRGSVQVHVREVLTFLGALDMHHHSNDACGGIVHAHFHCTHERHVF